MVNGSRSRAPAPSPVWRRTLRCGASQLFIGSRPSTQDCRLCWIVARWIVDEHPPRQQIQGPQHA
ncbi:hypothetical protein FOPG_17252 [Fusarium oxysporum f. sp. conglutinans race 2 54008]|uniref:Uncharacterized protein n=1 Tax=Fusarium oxysporum f. sp. conglutinans race 2 54008 TaxID=1089457 RepID=X0H3I2_FUSOX|nr:hypothetical protein FOPG_17252 [Fusarium oxysporum f. sp. conglutinans race 2 54008]